MTTIDHLVIVAGGKGTRLSDLFGDIPKALVPVGGKPVLQHQLELAARAGVRSATIFAGFLADQIAQFVGDGSRFGMNIAVRVEDEPLGNAGAVLQSLDSLPERFFVMYGDVMMAVDLERMARFHLDHAAAFTAFMHPNDHPFDSDLIEADAQGRVTALHNAPHAQDRVYNNLVNAALYVVERDALKPAPGKQDFTKDVMPGLITSGAKVLAYRSADYIKDMGTPERLARVEADLKSGKLDLANSNKPRAAVFLDRDGTLNIEKGFLASQDGMELLPGVGAALKSLRQAGYSLVVLTNQPVIARGEASEDDVAAIHRRLEWELGKEGAYLDAIYLCPHHPDKGFAGERPELKIACQCRKPGIAMVEQACRELNLNANASWMIGDQTRDIEMARRAGLRAILVCTGTAGRDGNFSATPDFVADDLRGAADLILEQKKVAA
jgi:D,D-heptose 1,7-bisphosphate phosphatase